MDKVKNPRGGGVSFPEGEGCQFFLPGGVTPPPSNKKELPVARDTFLRLVFDYVPVGKLIYDSGVGEFFL